MQFWGPATLLKKTPAQVLSCEVVKLFKNIYLKSICEHLLLNFIYKETPTQTFSCFPVDIQTSVSETAVCGCLFNKFANLTAWRPLTVLKDTAAQMFLCEFWLTSTVLWMNCSNLHLILNKKMVSLLYKVLWAFYKSDPYIMSVIKFIHIDMRHKAVMTTLSIWIFFVMLASLTKF